MKKIVLVFLVLFVSRVQAQVFQQMDAEARVKGAAVCRMDEKSGLPEFVRFRPEIRMDENLFLPWLKDNLKLNPGAEFRHRKSESDQLGMVHQKFEQYYKGVPVMPGVFSAHIRDGKIQSVSGDYYPVAQEPIPAISADQAKATAFQWMNAEIYKWEVEGADAELQRRTKNPNASWIPQAKLVYSPNPVARKTGQGELVRLAWMFDIYAILPLKRFEVYVDAVSGEVIFTNDKLHSTDVPGIANTKYSGQQEIITDSVSPTEYRLRESGRGGGIETLNCLTSTNTGSAVDFLDSNNVWNNFNPEQDEVATDAHWGAEMTYDYYLNVHSRDSWDNNGSMITSYVHYDNNMANAFWDGTMNFGDGGGGTSPFSSLDVLGHEFTHGVTGESAGLMYQDESGALNESFSDIFGAAIEYWVRPAQFNWLIGEDVTPLGIRNMANPNSFGNPSDYQGLYWFVGSGDNGGVHSNSGVQNYWFYLLSTGGSGINDNGEAFSVAGVGIPTAAQIAYRNLYVYLSPWSQYDDARFYSIESAIDLYGECSPEMISTMNAWHGCSLGYPFGTSGLVPDFTSDEVEYCNAPASVQFYNTSQGAVSWIWKFGDGATSNILNPVHTYSFYGTYDVTLVVFGCSTDVDTLIISDYITVNNSIPCRISMSANSSDSVTACDGTLMDSGGNQNYENNSVSTITIAPSGALSVNLTFLSFDFATAGDYLAVYDGPTTSSPVIGFFNGTTLPNGGTITSTGGAITLKESTNSFGSRPGFEADWSCIVSRQDPAQNFSFVIYPNPSSGNIFVDLPAGYRGSLSADLYNSMGQKVRHMNSFAEGAETIEMGTSGLPPGIYLVELDFQGERVAEKVILR